MKTWTNPQNNKKRKNEIRHTRTQDTRQKTRTHTFQNSERH